MVHFTGDDMHLTTATGLLLGLGARILVNAFTYSHYDNGLGFADSGQGPTVLIGLWKGVLLYHVMMEKPPLASGVFFGIAARLLTNYAVARDASKMATTLLGLGFGVLWADVMAQILDTRSWDDASSHDSYETSSNASTISSRRSSRRRRHALFRRFSKSRPVTEVVPESRALVVRAPSPPPHDETLENLQKEALELRRRASEAAGEKRKLQEEREWAKSQGNVARAFQLQWQIRKYDALADSFTREAIEKEALIAKRSQPRTNIEVRHGVTPAGGRISEIRKHDTSRRGQGRQVNDREYLEQTMTSPDGNVILSRSTYRKKKPKRTGNPGRTVEIHLIDSGEESSVGYMSDDWSKNID